MARYDKVKEERLKKKMSIKDMTELLNQIRLARGAKSITPSTYYKKENGEIPVFIDEAEDIAKVLGRSIKIFFN